MWIAAFLVEVESGAVPVPGVGGQPATVTRIVDGDTIEVSIDGSTHRLRHILINTPEPEQPYADEAQKPTGRWCWARPSTWSRT